MIPKTFRKTFCLLTGQKLDSLEGVCLITSGVKVTPCHHTDGKTRWWWCDGLGLFGCFWTWKLCCDQWNHEFISTPKHPGGKRLELKPVWVLQQDNDPKHSSRSTSERLKTNKIRTLEGLVKVLTWNLLRCCGRTLKITFMLEKRPIELNYNNSAKWKLSQTPDCSCCY